MKVDICKFKVDYGENDLGSYDMDKAEISVNLTNIKKACDDYYADFYTMLLHVINHEFLHHVLHIEHGKHTTTDFDNLTHDKQTDKNIWEYWLA